MRNKSEAGFSTLEVIAAVAIIAIALIPIAALQTQLARSQSNLAAAHVEFTSVNNAVALLRDINPMLATTGERRLDETTTLTWSATPISPARQSVNPPGFQVRLYRVSATIRRNDAPLTTTELDLVGWRELGEAGAR